MARLSALMIAELLLIACIGCGCGGGGERGEVSVSAGLADLTNLTRFATSPDGEMRMLSSYDRSGGNDDFSHFYGTLPDGSYILADLQGPGCVRRLWFTGLPPDQEMRFYFDGETTPRFVIPTRQRIDERRFPFLPPLCASPSAATYCYVPMPFAERLVVASGPSDGGKYFIHLNYELFNKNRPVRSFSLPLSAAESNQWHAAAEAWDKVYSHAQNTYRITGSGAASGAGVDAEAASAAVAPGPPEKEALPSVVLRPRAPVTALETDGPAVIRELRIDLAPLRNLPVLARNELLRLIVLRAWWDDADGPSVEVPLGDFFCNGLRKRQFASLPLERRGDLLVSRFPMPFRRSARIELLNEGAGPVTVGFDARIEPLEAWDRDLMYFHAQWQHSYGQGVPFPILAAEGRGQYAGCYLVAMSGEPSWNILEGDESVFIDGETAPSMHGTGLEDYFNGGWYYGGGTFWSALGGALEKRGIRTAQYRFHLPDPVPFSDSLRVNMEFGDQNRSRGYMSAAAYWYQERPRPVPVRLPPMVQRLVPRDPLEKLSMMCEVWERERHGLFGEAADLCREYAAKYPDGPQAELMQLRVLAYRELTEGYAAVAEDYARFAAQAQHDEARRQAGLLQWFQEAETNALIGAHINGKYRLFVDGEQVLAGDDVTRLHVAPLTLEQGPHVIAVEMERTRPDDWCTVYLRRHGENLWTDASWLCAAEPGEGWTGLEHDGGEWKPVFAHRGLLPKMQWFHFEPNAIVLSQHRELIGPSVRGKTAYFRREFVQP